MSGNIRFGRIRLLVPVLLVIVAWTARVWLVVSTLALMFRVVLTEIANVAWQGAWPLMITGPRLSAVVCVLATVR